MSYEIIKHISVNFKTRKIAISSTSNNVSPRTYRTWHPVESGYDFDEWLRMFAMSCFDGSSQFLPSCTSKAYEACLRANEEVGLESGRIGPTYGTYVYGSAEYMALFDKWYDYFLNFLKNKRTSTEKFIGYLKKTDEPVIIKIHKGRYGRSYARYWFARKPKEVTWLQKTYIETHFDSFKFEPVR